MIPKVQIGAKYNGPHLDRPCLRRLPPGWHLNVEKSDTTTWGDVAVLVVVLYIAVLIATQVIS